MRKLILLAILTLSTATPVFGQDSSFVQNAQQQLNQIEAKQASSSATTTGSAKNTGSISYIEGIVVSLQTNSFWLSTTSGTVLVSSNDSTKFIQIDTSKKLIGLGDLKIGDDLMVLGLVKNSVLGTAKIVVRDRTAVVKTFALLGTVNSALSTSITFNNFPDSNLGNLTFNLANNFTITSEKGSQLTPTDLSPQDRIVLTGSLDNSGKGSVNKILRIQTAPTPTATGSAQ